MSQFYNKIQKKEQEFKDKLEFAIDLANKLHVTGYEVNIASKKGLSVSSRNCELENIEFEYDRAMTITIYNGHKQAYAATTDLSHQAIKDTMQAAFELTKYTNDDPCNAVLEEQYLCKEMKDFDVLHEIEDNADAAVNRCIELEQYALDKKAKGIIKSNGANFFSGVYTNGYAASNGFCAVSSASSNSLNLSLIGEQDGKMQTSGGFSSHCNLTKLDSTEKIANEAICDTVDKLDVAPIATGAYNIVFSKQAAITLISNLYKAISGSLIYKQSSFLLDMLDKQVFPNFINIVEDPFVVGRLESSCYDDEGCKRNVTSLIEDGYLRTYLLSSYSARKLKMQPNGHCGGLGSVFVKAKEQCSFEDLLANTKRGIVVTELMGQGVDIVSGNYSQGASGYYFENGQRVHAVDEITIASNLKDLFLNIQALANDYDYRYKTKCPSFMIEGITVSSKS